MKKSSIYIIFVLVVVAAIVAGLAVRYVPSVVPYWQCSEVYKRYSKVEGVCASYIKDYRINDTLTLGVTLLWIRQTLKDHPEIRYDENDDSSSDTKEVEIVAISISKQEICVLHTQNEQERDAVFYKKIESNF